MTTYNLATELSLWPLRGGRTSRRMDSEDPPVRGGRTPERLVDLGGWSIGGPDEVLDTRCGADARRLLPARLSNAGDHCRTGWGWEDPADHRARDGLVGNRDRTDEAGDAEGDKNS